MRVNCYASYYTLFKYPVRTAEMSDRADIVAFEEIMTTIHGQSFKKSIHKYYKSIVSGQQKENKHKHLVHQIKVLEMIHGSKNTTPAIKVNIWCNDY